MIYGLETIFTLFLALIAFVIVIAAQVYLSSTYKKGKEVRNSVGLSGCEVARKILDSNGLTDVYVVQTEGTLSDHYDPKRKVIRLSKDIFHGTTVAAAAVAAHECGHAIQDKDNYTFMRIRGALVPFVNLITYIGYIALIISLFAGITGYLTISIGLIIVALVFQFITLPVEFDASRRALNEIERLSLVAPNEHELSKTVLRAAALTYVASLISTILDLLRLVIMFNDRD